MPVLAPAASIVAPIFALILLGFAVVRTGYVEAGVIRALGAFVLRLAMPALIFAALASAPLGETLNAGYLAGYGAASLTVFAAGYLAGRGGTPAAMQGLGMACTNSGFLGFPIASLAVGSTAAAGVLAQNFLIENLVIIPAALVLAELGRGETGRGARRIAWDLVRSLGRNPLILAILAGMAVAASGLAVPGWLMRPAEMLGGVAAPVALVVIGGTIAGLSRSAMPAGTWKVVAGKLALHPLAVLVALMLVPGMGPLLVATGVIFASVPMITIYPIIATQFGEEQAAAAALLAATIAAVVTVPLVLIALDAGGLMTLGREGG